MKQKRETFQVELTGLRPLMFDRYSGDNKSVLPPEQKLYMQAGGRLFMPSRNIISFLSAKHTESACKRFNDPRKYKGIASAMLSYVDINPFEIPLLRNGKQIVFDGKWDPENVDIQYDVARLKDGSANPKQRPVVALPWELKFDLTVLENDEVEANEVHRLFVLGGQALGLGTFRGVYGKFDVSSWAKAREKGKKA